MMTVLAPEKVIALTRASLGLPVMSHAEALDDALLAGLLRRVAGLHCPCSPATLKLVMFQTLEGVVALPKEDLSSRFDFVINSLQTGGDLLELARVTTMDERARGTWVFLAPPSFVELPSGTIRIFGMASEETLPLPDGLRERVVANGTGRTIEPVSNENLREVLERAGFREQSIESWLRVPRECTSIELIKSIDARLQAANHAGEVDQLRILSSVKPNARYSERWTSPVSETGRFLSRRPQAYGADLWGYVELENGVARRLLDFPLPGSAYRGCDDAWWLQLALDSATGNSQRYRVRLDRGSATLDLFFPIPIWAQRRLEVVGARVAPHGSLMSFQLPSAEVETECKFLETALWLHKAAD